MPRAHFISRHWTISRTASYTRAVSQRVTPKPPVVAGPGKKKYARPEIVWREPYEPMGFGISCAKQPGNPQCNPGPASS